MAPPLLSPKHIQQHTMPSFWPLPQITATPTSSTTHSSNTMHQMNKSVSTTNTIRIKRDYDIDKRIAVKSLSV